MGDSKIQWTEKTWNPLRGCSRVSPGCEHCYAEKIAARFAGPGQPFAGYATERGWTRRVNLLPEKLDEPLRWRKPAMVFANSMSDLFHRDIPNEHIAAVFGVMAAARKHTFQVLTKRAERLPEWFAWIERHAAAYRTTPVAAALHYAQDLCKHPALRDTQPILEQPWPLPNVWLGVSTEDQQRADERIPRLLDTPAAVRFVSYEPALGPIDFTRIRHHEGLHEDVLGDGERRNHPEHGAIPSDIDWIIVGGESGPGARSCWVEWIERTVAECRAARIPCFVKQLGAYWSVLTDAEFPRLTKAPDPKWGDPAEWPEHLRVREFPEVRG